MGGLSHRLIWLFGTFLCVHISVPQHSGLLLLPNCMCSSENAWAWLMCKGLINERRNFRMINHLILSSTSHPYPDNPWLSPDTPQTPWQCRKGVCTLINMTMSRHWGSDTVLHCTDTVALSQTGTRITITFVITMLTQPCCFFPGLLQLLAFE